MEETTLVKRFYRSNTRLFLSVLTAGLTLEAIERGGWGIEWMRNSLVVVLSCGSGNKN